MRKANDSLQRAARDNLIRGEFMKTRFAIMFGALFVAMFIQVIFTNQSGNAQQEQIRIETKEDPVGIDSGPPPKIEFEQKDLVYDLGVVPQRGNAKAIMKFKNTGKGVLKIESVKAG